MNFNQEGYYMGNADLKLPSGGGKWLYVDASRFEDIEQLNEYKGTEIVRVSMYGNRYPYMKAFDLFGVIPGYGAQIPE